MENPDSVILTTKRVVLLSFIALAVAAWISWETLRDFLLVFSFGFLSLFVLLIYLADRKDVFTRTKWAFFAATVSVAIVCYRAATYPVLIVWSIPYIIFAGLFASSVSCFIASGYCLGIYLVSNIMNNILHSSGGNVVNLTSSDLFYILQVTSATIVASAVASSVSDFWRRKLEEAKLSAYLDELTKAYNRKALSDLVPLLRRTVSGDGSYGIAFIMLDLDNFKKVNDTYGHAEGDALLRKVGVVLRQSLRRHDYVVRIGGDEFLVILCRVPFKVALDIAGRLIKRISELHPVIGASAGLYFLPSDVAVKMTYSQFERCIEKADVALYEAKKSGKNCVYYWDITGMGIFRGG